MPVSVKSFINGGESKRILVYLGKDPLSVELEKSVKSGEKKYSLFDETAPTETILAALREDDLFSPIDGVCLQDRAKGLDLDRILPAFGDGTRTWLILAFPHGTGSLDKRISAAKKFAKNENIPLDTFDTEEKKPDSLILKYFKDAGGELRALLRETLLPMGESERNEFIESARGLREDELWEFLFARRGLLDNKMIFRITDAYFQDKKLFRTYLKRAALESEIHFPLFHILLRRIFQYYDCNLSTEKNVSGIDASHLGVPPFVYENIRGEARRYPLKKLIPLILGFADLDLRLKSLTSSTRGSLDSFFLDVRSRVS